MVGFSRSISIVCFPPFNTGTYLSYLDAPKGGAALLCVKPVGAVRYSEFACWYYPVCLIGRRAEGGDGG